MCKETWFVFALVLTYPICFLFGMGLEQSIQQDRAVKANVAYYDTKTKEFKFIILEQK